MPLVTFTYRGSPTFLAVTNDGEAEFRLFLPGREVTLNSDIPWVARAIASSAEFSSTPTIPDGLPPVLGAIKDSEGASVAGSLFTVSVANTGGTKNVRYSVTGLPEEAIDEDTGIIRTELLNPGTYPITVTATNSAGSDSVTFSLQVGSGSTTPPDTTAPAIALLNGPITEATTGTQLSFTLRISDAGGLNASTLTLDKFLVRNPSDQVVARTINVTGPDNQKDVEVTLTPGAGTDGTYEIAVAAGITDAAGNALAPVDPLATFDVVASSLNPDSLFSATAQDSATPAANTFTMQSGTNAFRLFAEGEAPYTPTEPWLDVYVKINAEAVKQVRIYWYQARYIVAPAGASIGLGVVGGKTLAVHTASLDLDSIPVLPASTATATANCDKAGPPIWVPSAPHITWQDTTPQSERVFQVPAATGEAKVFFVSEYDGTDWTPPRFYWQELTKPVLVQCAYDQAAIANYAGTSLGITTIDTATVGGSSSSMTLPTFSVTGATRNASTVPELMTAVAAAVSGDEIVLANGTFSLAADITDASFTAAGQNGAEGILIRSASNDPSLCTITGGSLALSHGGSTVETRIQGIGFNYSGLDKQFSLLGGKYTVENCDIFGPVTSLDLFDVGTGFGFDVDCLVLNSSIHNGSDGEDVINGSGNAAAFKGLLINVEAYGSGTAANSQVLTGHFGSDWVCFGCDFSGGKGSDLVANDGSTLNYLYFSRFGLENSGTVDRVRHSSALGCIGALADPATSNWVLMSEGKAVLNQFRNYTGGTNKVRHNYLKGTGAETRVFFNNSAGGGHLSYNIIENVSEGVLMQFSSAAQTRSYFRGNTFSNNNTAFRLVEANLPTTLENNACVGNTTSIDTTTSAMSVYQGSSNILDPAVDADYIAQTGDVVGADAQLNTSFIPVAAGNADNGQGAAITEPLGLSDWAGLVYLYADGAQPIGARARPVNDGDIYPDAV